MNDFELVLDKDEQILKTYKPNKARAMFSAIILSLFMFLIFSPMAFGAMEEDGAGWIVILVWLSISLLFALFVVLMYALWLKKTVFAVTNKRILIRTGFIGVDYKSLDYTLLGAFTVNVNWVDKLMRKNTGTLAFGSTASPMVSNTNTNFRFAYIKNPYESYKEIKAIIDEYKAK